MSDFDTIVIGSGAGGLTAALSLARVGQRVLVLEQHNLPGGWCHSFSLEGFLFSPGVHYIGQLHTRGRLRRIYEGLGVAKGRSGTGTGRSGTGTGQYESFVKCRVPRQFFDRNDAWSARLLRCNPKSARENSSQTCIVPETPSLKLRPRTSLEQPLVYSL